MRLFGIFKAQNRRQRAGAILYPDKIIIQTIHTIKNSYGVISSDVSILNANEDSESLGRTLRKHLAQSRDDLKTTETGQYKDFLKATGLKTRKEHYKNARYLVIDNRNGKISLTPTINGGTTGKDRGFAETTEIITMDTQVTDKELGVQLQYGWTKCV